MPYVNMRDMLSAARSGGYAVGAFNIVDLATACAVVRAAEAKRAPVIIQTSVKTVQCYGLEPIVGMVRGLAEASVVPVALHLDHCKDVAFVKRCVDAGWSSVMLDGSAEPFEKNAAMTEEVVAYAHAADVTVEGELGAIVGVEDDIFVKERDAHLADPDQAVAFVNRTGVDVFAPAIGTAHGLYKGEPQIAFDRLERISKESRIPIAIHGGTGLSAEVFRRCVALGGAKINISTQIKHIFRDSLEAFFRDHPKDYEPVKPVGHMLQKAQTDIEGFIQIFGSAGKVAE